MTAYFKLMIRILLFLPVPLIAMWFNFCYVPVNEPVDSFPADPQSEWFCDDHNDEEYIVGLFLRPSAEYIVKLSSGSLLKFNTLNSPFNPEISRTFITMPHIETPRIVGPLIIHCHEEYFWTTNFDACFWEKLFIKGLFVLPHGDNAALVPNPKLKFAMHIDTDTRSYKKQKKWKIDSFDFTCTQNLLPQLEYSLLQCRNWHIQFGRTNSSWISDKFVQVISEIVGGHSPRIKFHVFQLLERDSGKLAAVSIGYRIGNAFMDFTACTLIRDKRSSGRLLLALQGDWLKSQGVKLWYLGFKLGYMESISDNFQEYDRSTFQQLWDKHAFSCSY